VIAGVGAGVITDWSYVVGALAEGEIISPTSRTFQSTTSATTVSSAQRGDNVALSLTGKELTMTLPIAGVTGAGSGIGAAIAETLGARGFHVVVTDVDLDSAERTASRLESAKALRLDVTIPTPVTPWSTPSSPSTADLTSGFPTPAFPKCNDSLTFRRPTSYAISRSTPTAFFTAANRRRGP